MAARRRVFSDVGGAADHFMRYGSTQWMLPTEAVYKELTDRYDLRSWNGFREYEDLRREYEDLRREYEDLRREYEDLRPVHNLDAEHCNVWRTKWTSNSSLHPCAKPVPILERMIKTSSRPGDVVLDPFMGSGSTGIACLNTGREFIGIERDDHYYEVAADRIRRAESELAQKTGTE